MRYHQYRRAGLNALNRFLGLFGWKLGRHNLAPHDYVSAKLYNDLVNEIQGYYTAYVVPTYSPTPERTELLCKLLGTNISEALYLLHCLHESAHLEGDICEFGIAQGATSALLANELGSSRKNLWLFDSFQGLSKPTEKDVLIHDISNVGSMEGYEGSMAVPITQVQRRLSEIHFPSERVKIVPGFIEKTLQSSNLPQRVSVAYVDFDFYEPIAMALQFLDRALVSGGFIIIDDYGFFSAGAKTAVDEFYDAKRDSYIMLNVPKYAGHFAILQKR